MANNDDVMLGLQANMQGLNVGGRGRGRGRGKGKGGGRAGNGRGRARGRAAGRGRGGLGPCPVFPHGLCPRPHPWTGAPGCCFNDHDPQPAGFAEWDANRQALAQHLPIVHHGWEYGELLDEAVNGRQAALAYRRVAIDAIRELRRQYQLVMNGDDIPRVLFYAQPDELQSTAHLWTPIAAVNVPAHLPAVVLGVRRLVETLLYERLQMNQNYLLGADADARMAMVSHYLMRLVSGSGPHGGPDVPLNWAAHNQRNHFGRTVVTERTLIEITAKLGFIFAELFRDRIPAGVEVNPQAVSVALRAAFNAPSILPGNIALTANGTSSLNQAHNNPHDVFAAAIAAALAAPQP